MTFFLLSQVVDPETEEVLGPNKAGELRVKFDFMMAGYYKMDSSSVFDYEGYLRTGDVVRYDEDHCLYIVNRIKEMFKCKGIHIIPSLLEDALMDHPSIKECAVVGVPHEIDGYHPLAAVVLKKGEKATPEEIEEFVDTRVYQSYRLLGGVKFVDHLPKNSNGKLVRDEIKKMLKIVP